ncbi:hypothetical protein C8J56DRAFT_922814 [Mycena floridula]|nr:hypothetical protein C8J56DRAFT_922814 [Mycena floridula]
MRSISTLFLLYTKVWAKTLTASPSSIGYRVRLRLGLGFGLLVYTCLDVSGSEHMFRAQLDETTSVSFDST